VSKKSVEGEKKKGLQSTKRDMEGTGGTHENRRVGTKTKSPPISSIQTKEEQFQFKKGKDRIEKGWKTVLPSRKEHTAGSFSVGTDEGAPWGEGRNVRRGRETKVGGGEVVNPGPGRLNLLQGGERETHDKRVTGE